MADLRISLEKAGFKNVQTYIQSGNVLIDSEETLTSIREGVKKVILKYFGFDVPVLVITRKEIEAILNNYPFKKVEEKNQYFVLLYNMPKKVLIDAFNKLQFSTEDFYFTENCVYLNCKKGAGKAKLTTNLIERKLGVIATTRNLRTMQKMVALTN